MPRYLVHATCFEHAAYLDIEASDAIEALEVFDSEFRDREGHDRIERMWPVSVIDIDTDRPDMARFWHGNGRWLSF